MSREDLLRGLPRRPVPSAGGGLAAASAGPHLERHRPALDDDPLGGGRVDRSAVGVADDVGHAADQDGMQPFGQVGGDDAAGLEVLGAALDHLGVVDLGELRIDPASVVRSPELDALLAAAGVPLVWNEKAARYVAKQALVSGVTGLVSTTRRAPRATTGTGTRPGWRRVEDAVLAADDRLLGTLEQGGWLVVTVAPRRLARAERQLAGFADVALPTEGPHAV